MYSGTANSDEMCPQFPNETPSHFLSLSLVSSLTACLSLWLQSTQRCHHHLSPFPLVPRLRISLLAQNMLVCLVCLSPEHIALLRTTITQVEKVNLILVTSIPWLAIFARKLRSSKVKRLSSRARLPWSHMYSGSTCCIQ